MSEWETVEYVQTPAREGLILTRDQQDGAFDTALDQFCRYTNPDWDSLTHEQQAYRQRMAIRVLMRHGYRLHSTGELHLSGNFNAPVRMFYKAPRWLLNLLIKLRMLRPYCEE